MNEQEDCITFYNVHSQPFSNFYSSPFVVNQKQYLTAEHYYQSKKFAGTDLQNDIINSKSIQSCHYLGQSQSHNNKFVEQWNKIRQKVYEEAVFYKFIQNKQLGQKLLATGNKKIINIDQDTFWGMKFDQVQNKLIGQNKTGQILMKVRTILKQK